MDAPIRKGDRRRQAILQAIERLLDQRSIADLSVEDIAKASGISRSGFYFYFDSKYAALSETLLGVFAELIDVSAPFYEGTDEPPSGYFRRTVASAVETWEAHERLAVAMIEASVSDPGAEALWRNWIEGFVPAVAGRIEAERAAGRAPAGVPARPLSRILVLGCERMLYHHSRERRSPADSAQLVETITHLWMTSIWGERPAAA